MAVEKSTTPEKLATTGRASRRSRPELDRPRRATLRRLHDHGTETAATQGRPKKLLSDRPRGRSRVAAAHAAHEGLLGLNRSDIPETLECLEGGEEGRAEGAQGRGRGKKAMAIDVLRSYPKSCGKGNGHRDGCKPESARSNKYETGRPGEHVGIPRPLPYEVTAGSELHENAQQRGKRDRNDVAAELRSPSPGRGRRRRPPPRVLRRTLPRRVPGRFAREGRSGARPERHA